jgi:hypothetical protein
MDQEDNPVSKIFNSLRKEVEDEESLRLKMKEAFSETIDALSVLMSDPKVTDAEKLQLIEVLLSGMSVGLENLRNYNDRQYIILESFKNLLNRTDIQ